MLCERIVCALKRLHAYGCRRLVSCSHSHWSWGKEVRGGIVFFALAETCPCVTLSHNHTRTCIQSPSRHWWTAAEGASSLAATAPASALPPASPMRPPTPPAPPPALRRRGCTALGCAGNGRRGRQIPSSALCVCNSHHVHVHIAAAVAVEGVHGRDVEAQLRHQAHLRTPTACGLDHVLRHDMGANGRVC